MNLKEIKKLNELANKKDCATMEQFNETALAYNKWLKLANENFLQVVMALYEIDEALNSSGTINTIWLNNFVTHKIKNIKINQ